MALAIRRSGEGEVGHCLHRRRPSPTAPRPVGQGFVSSPLKGRGDHGHCDPLRVLRELCVNLVRIRSSFTQRAQSSLRLEMPDSIQMVYSGHMLAPFTLEPKACRAQLVSPSRPRVFVSSCLRVFVSSCLRANPKPLRPEQQKGRHPHRMPPLNFVVEAGFIRRRRPSFRLDRCPGPWRRHCGRPVR